MSTPAPVVSVVIPTYDRPEMVRRAVGSVLAQGLPVEVIVVDDHSPDPYIYEGIELQEPVRVLRQPVCLGVAAARNRGIAAARGRYVAFLDDDDLWLPGKLDRQLAGMERTGRRWCFTAVSYVDEHLEELIPFTPSTGAAPPAFEVDNRIGTPSSVIVERELLWESGGFSSSLSVLADWDLWIRLSQVEEPHVVDEPLVQYVTHPGAMHLTKIWESLHDRRVLARRYGQGRRLGGFSYWIWTVRSLRDAGRPASAALVAAYVGARFPGAMGHEILSRVRRGRRGPTDRVSAHV